MASQSWAQLIAVLPIQGTLLNTFTTAKSLTSTSTEASQAIVALPSGFFQRGGYLRVTTWFGLSNIITTPGTFTLQIMLGSTVAFTTGAINFTSTAANTLIPTKAVFDLTVQKVGVGNAQLMGNSVVSGVSIAGTTGLANGAANTGQVIAPTTAPALGTAFDSTIAQTLDIFGAFSISNAGNGIQLAQYAVESWGNTGT